jgi:zinc/manganese transport system permease protein
MIRDLAVLLAAPFAATLVLLGIHVWFGLHILRRRVIFADLALAQISALGATLAVALGHAPGEPTSFVYSLLFALSGAALLTASRSLAQAVSQEALIGILYVAATAATVLVIDQAPQGAEHVKRMLVGTLLTVGPAQLAQIVPLYAAVALLHWLARRPLLNSSEARGHGTAGVLWDFVFYASFAVVVTSSVAIAGVLLVFSLLIIPAVIGMLFAPGMFAALLIGWAAGLAACSAGFAMSVAFDLPTGATLVLALAAGLGLAATLRLLWHGELAARRRNRRRMRRSVMAAVPLAVLLGSALSLLQPGADQPLLAALEPLGLRPELFLHAAEAAQYDDAQQTEQRYRRYVDGLSDQERQSRWQGVRLTDEQVWRIGSYQQSYNEMGKGERFVQDFLLARARQRERWLVSLPLGVLSALALLFMWRPHDCAADAQCTPMPPH